VRRKKGYLISSSKGNKLKGETEPREVVFFNFTPMKKTVADKVILVNDSGRKIGVSDKMRVHTHGILHRAFSIFIFNDEDKMLLQKRAASKYHFANLWTNACCSHPRPGEKIITAAKRRLMEEIGISTPLKVIGNIRYSFFDKKTQLTENEFDFILKGHFNSEIIYNPEEVAAIQWISTDQLLKELSTYPQKYTPWFKEIIYSSHFRQMTGF
jgi:isopentenyl-diphosphate delta-isomerase